MTVQAALAGDGGDEKRNGSRLVRAAFWLLAGAVLVRICLSLLAPYLGFDMPEGVISQNDIFADSIKAGLAVRAVSEPLFHDPSVKTWWPVFQDYLFNNPYLTPVISIYHSPPLSYLQLIAIAKSILLVSPFPTLAILISVNAGLALVIVWLFRRPSVPVMQTMPWALGILILSYPALFMVNRANYVSGFTSLGIVAYLLSLATRRYRILGMLGLALAINYRPNAAIISLAEFAYEDSWLRAVRAIAAEAVLSLVIGGAALVVVHATDPAYTPEHFLWGYGLYHRGYVIGDAGLAWNDSLYGAIKFIRLSLGFARSYNPVILIGLSVMSLIVAGGLVCTFVMRRTGMAQAAFLLTGFCCLLTPVFGEYHILIMAAPLLIIALTERIGTPAMTGWIFWLTLAGLQLCTIVVSARFDVLPRDGSVLLLAIVAVAVPITIRVVYRTASDRDRTTQTILTTSLLTLSPLGDGITHGVVVAALLVSSMSLVMGDIWRHAPARGFRFWGVRQEPSSSRGTSARRLRRGLSSATVIVTGITAVVTMIVV